MDGGNKINNANNSHGRLFSTPKQIKPVINKINPATAQIKKSGTNIKPATYPLSLLCNH